MSEQQHRAPSPSSEERPPYEPPRIEESAVFETLSLQCGRTSGPDCYYSGGFKS